MKLTWLNEYQYQLSIQIIQNTLPHAILFTGIHGSGKQTLANWLVNVLLCQQPQQSATSDNSPSILQPCGQCKHCHLYHAGSFPDHQTIISEKATIGVDEIRKTNAFLQKTAQLSGNQTVLIPQAQTMTESAANALLKTLEEPSNKSHLILIANDAGRLLPTIISRCRVITIRVPNHSINERLLTDNKHNGFLNLTHINELTNNDIQEQYQAFNSALSDFLLHGYNQQAMLELMLSNDEAIRWCEKLFTDMLRYSHGWPVTLTPSIQQAITNNSLTSMLIRQWYQCFVHSQKQLVTLVQANKAFVLEAMLITIKQLRSINSTTN